MFTGLSAFPLTPLAHDAVDEAAFIRLVERLSEANVDSITALGSTGSYAYLSSDERSRVAELAVRARRRDTGGRWHRRAADLPGSHERGKRGAGRGFRPAARTDDLPDLTGDEVFELFRTVTAHSSLPVVVYDNPGTTRSPSPRISMHA